MADDKKINDSESSLKENITYTGLGVMGAAYVTEKAAPKVLTDTAEKTVTKLAGRTIYGVGAFLCANSAYEYFKNGHYGQAGIEVASGVASFIPGIGTVTSVALTGVNLYLDGTKDTLQNTYNNLENEAKFAADMQKGSTTNAIVKRSLDDMMKKEETFESQKSVGKFHDYLYEHFDKSKINKYSDTNLKDITHLRIEYLEKRINSTDDIDKNTDKKKLKEEKVLLEAMEIALKPENKHLLKSPKLDETINDKDTDNVKALKALKAAHPSIFNTIANGSKVDKKNLQLSLTSSTLLDLDAVEQNQNLFTDKKMSDDLKNFNLLHRELFVENSLKHKYSYDYFTKIKEAFSSLFKEEENAIMQYQHQDNSKLNAQMEDAVKAANEKMSKNCKVEALKMTSNLAEKKGEELLEQEKKKALKEAGVPSMLM